MLPRELLHSRELGPSEEKDPFRRSCYDLVVEHSRGNGEGPARQKLVEFYAGALQSPPVPSDRTIPKTTGKHHAQSCRTGLRRELELQADRAERFEAEKLNTNFQWYEIANQIILDAADKAIADLQNSKIVNDGRNTAKTLMTNVCDN